MKNILAGSKVVLQNGKPREVIISWGDFTALLEKLEDADDAAYIKNVKKQKDKLSFKPLDEVLKDV